MSEGKRTILEQQGESSKRSKEKSRLAAANHRFHPQQLVVFVTGALP
jgi:hypothetical protein